MSTMQKYGFPFTLALSLHIGLLLLFSLSFDESPEKVTQPKHPEIIHASVLDDKLVLQEAQRLKQTELDKKLAQQQKQQQLARQRKREEKLLQQARQKRLQEEKKAQTLAKKHKQDEIRAQKRQAQLKKQQAEEAARLKKIKQQQAKEQKRLQQQKKQAAKKREQKRRAEEKKQRELLARQNAEKEQAKQKAAAEKARAEKDRHATITATAAIQRKVNNSWIRPITSSKGLRCTIRVKLLSSGDVMDATVISSSGDAVFDRSAENAVRKASPLPVPADKSLFTRKFRTFIFVFKPE